MFKLLILFTIVYFTYQDEISIQPNEYYSEIISGHDNILYSVESLDGSIFSMVALPGVVDNFPDKPYYNLVNNCDFVLECNGAI